VDRDYAKLYRDLFEKHWWWRARAKYVIETLRRYCPSAGWPTILDIGCGDGLFFEQLKQFGKVQGIEPCAELVSRDNPERDCIYIGPFDEHFAPAEKYSLILMLDVLEHLAEPVGAVRHAMELLRPEGIFMATVPAFTLLWTNHDLLNHHFTRYTVRSFRQLAARAGLEIKQSQYLFHWIFPLKLGARVAEYAFERKAEPPTIPGCWVNELFYGLTRFEQLTLSRLPIPFGTSLMVVGKKAR
jgi:2-polyprenyl-3-methyl-5-hydroxy-6-metoxy-1,4-benzoquinol methylase